MMNCHMIRHKCYAVHIKKFDVDFSHVIFKGNLLEPFKKSSQIYLTILIWGNLHVHLTILIWGNLHVHD